VTTKSKRDPGRCWPGYVPVPGKAPNEQGSCRPKAASKLSPKEKAVRDRRRRQLERLARAGVPPKQRSARRRALAPPKGVSAEHRKRGSAVAKRRSAKRRRPA
jgi:hypothetical protein